MRTFLGITGYYRSFIPQFASISAALTDLTWKSSPNKINWTPACDFALSKLKQLLCAAPVLCSPDFEKQFILQTDASYQGVEAVLSQLDDKGMDHPVAYYSRKLFPREEKYSTVEKECLAMKVGVEAFRVYLLG